MRVWPAAGQMLCFELKKRVLSLVVGAVFAAVAAAAVVVPAEAGPARPGDPANEILQNGLDALSDNQPEEARQFFERVLRAYPRSAAAHAAEQELGNLKHGESSGRGETDLDDRPEMAEPVERPVVERPVVELPVVARRGPERPVDPAGVGASRKSETDERNGRLRRAFLRAGGDRVFFAENSASIGGRARAALEGQARWLKVRPNIKVTIISRADDGGSPTDSMALSQKRAEAVRDKLVQSGLAADSVQIDARGDRDPISTCRTAQCQAQNRHVETLVSFVSGPAVSGVTGHSLTGHKDAEATQPVNSRPLTR